MLMHEFVNKLRCAWKLHAELQQLSDLHDTDMIPSSSLGHTLVTRTLKLLVGILDGSSAHAGQFFVAHTLDFFVASPRVVRRVIIDVARITAAKFIFDYCVQHSPRSLES